MAKVRGSLRASYRQKSKLFDTVTQGESNQVYNARFRGFIYHRINLDSCNISVLFHLFPLSLPRMFLSTVYVQFSCARKSDFFLLSLAGENERRHILHINFARSVIKSPWRLCALYRHNGDQGVSRFSLCPAIRRK